MIRFEEVSIPLSRLECSQSQHFWVVVTGVKDEKFPSLEQFLRNRCGDGIRIVEKKKDADDGHYLWASNRYQVLVHDNVENSILSFDERQS
jgi:hypothetical protein